MGNILGIIILGIIVCKIGITVVVFISLGILIIGAVIIFSKAFFDSETKGDFVSDINLSENDKNNLYNFGNYLIKNKYTKENTFFNNKTNELFVLIHNSNKNIDSIYNKQRNSIDKIINKNVELEIKQYEPKIPKTINQDYYESTDYFKIRVKKEEDKYNNEIIKFNQYKKDYLSILENLNSHGYYNTIFNRLYEKVFGKKNKYIYDSIFTIYANSIKEYYNNPYIEDIYYNPDTKKLYLKQKFSLLEEVILIEFNVNVSEAKEIIENKNFKSAIIFKTNFKNIDIKEIIIFVNNTFLKGIVTKEKIEKIVLQEVKINFDELNMTTVIKKPTISSNIHQLSDKVNEQLNSDIYNKMINHDLLSSKDLIELKSTIEIQSKTIKNLEEYLQLQSTEINTLKKDSKDKESKQTQQINELVSKIENFDKIGVQSKIIKELDNQILSQSNEINKMKKDYEKEQTIYVNELLQKIENFNGIEIQLKNIKNLDNQLLLQSKEIYNIKKEFLDKEIKQTLYINELVQKIEKLEELSKNKPSSKSEKKPLNMPIQIENQTINKTDGELIKRDSFDDF